MVVCQCVFDRISTPAPTELLEASPVFADSCGGPISACTLRRICSALTWHGSLPLWIGGFLSLGQNVFETVRVCRMVPFPCGDLGSALPVVRSPSNPCSQRRSELRHNFLREEDASAILSISGFSLLSVRLPFLGSPWECILLVQQCGGRFPPRDFRIFPKAFRGSSVLLCCASECCGTTPLLHCCS